ncbi:hypothetical protein CR513_39201, partial [Mucuna pruriens]
MSIGPPSLVLEKSLDKSSSRSIDDEVFPMPQKCKKMMKKNGKYKNYPKKEKYKKYSKGENNEIICFEFKKPRHIKEECPNPKKR